MSKLEYAKRIPSAEAKVAQVKTPDADIPVLAVEFVLIRPKAMQSSRMTESYAPSAKTMRKPCVKTLKKRNPTNR